jgi:hypothetical protein
MSGVEFSENVARQRSWLDNDKLAHEFTAPPWLDASAGIVAFGNPIPKVFGTSWWLRSIKVPLGGMTEIRDDRRRREMIKVPKEEQVSPADWGVMTRDGDWLPQTEYEASLTDESFTNSREIQQFRAFGWPLRSVILHGVMRTVEWPRSPENERYERIVLWRIRADIVYRILDRSRARLARPAGIFLTSRSRATSTAGIKHDRSAIT